MVEDEVNARPRDKRREPLQELDRVEEQMGRPVTPRTPELEPDLAVRGPLEPLLGDRGPQGVAGQPLEPIPLIGVHADPRVQVEAGVPCVTRPEGGTRRRREPLVAEATDASSRSWAEGGPALHGGGGEPRQNRSVVGPGIHRVAGRLDLEVVGGSLITLGLFTPWAAFIASGELAVAFFLVHFPRGVWPIMNGGEPAVLFCFVFLFFATRDSGAWSLDRMLRNRK